MARERAWAWWGRSAPVRRRAAEVPASSSAARLSARAALARFALRRREEREAPALRAAVPLSRRGERAIEPGTREERWG